MFISLPSGEQFLLDSSVFPFILLLRKNSGKFIWLI